MRLVAREYADFGPTLAAEYLAEKHGVKVSKETLRHWLIAAGVWKRKRRRVEEVHVGRARRPCRGELVQWDTCEHDWLEGRGPKLCLLAMLDDASRRALARFEAHDTTAANLRLLGTYLERWGRPVEFYPDKDSLFTVNRSQAHPRMKPGKRRGHRSGGRGGNWGRAGFRRTRRKPRGGSSASSGRRRTGW